MQIWSSAAEAVACCALRCCSKTGAAVLVHPGDLQRTSQSACPAPLRGPRSTTSGRHGAGGCSASQAVAVVTMPGGICPTAGHAIKSPCVLFLMVCGSCGMQPGQAADVHSTRCAIWPELMHHVSSQWWQPAPVAVSPQASSASHSGLTLVMTTDYPGLHPVGLCPMSTSNSQKHPAWLQGSQVVGV
jgi:hypothetical protein